LTPGLSQQVPTAALITINVAPPTTQPASGKPASVAFGPTISSAVGGGLSACDAFNYDVGCSWLNGVLFAERASWVAATQGAGAAVNCFPLISSQEDKA
jgi:hypothetical protein